MDNQIENISEHSVLISIALTVVSLFSGVLLYITAQHYWDFIDFLAYPVSIYEHGVDYYQYPYDESLLFAVLVEGVNSFKETILEALIYIFGYNLMYPAILLQIIVLASCLYFVFNDHKDMVRYVPIVVCLIAFTVFVLPSNSATKMQVDKKFIDYKYQQVNIVSYRDLLKEGKYKQLDETLLDLEKKFENGGITQQEYEYEYDKFRKFTEEQLDYFNKWIEVTNVPEYAYMARGILLNKIGWRKRGSAFISKASEEQIAGMKKYFKLSIQDHLKALEINNNRLFSYRGLIDMHFSRLVPYEMEALYQMAEKAFPENYFINIKYMKYLKPRWGGSYEKMREHSRKLRQYSKNDPTLVSLSGVELYDRAKYYENDNQYEEASKMANFSLLYGPQKGNFIYLADLYYNLEDYDKAIDVMSSALGYYENYPLFLTYRATAYNAIGEHESAFDDIERIDISKFDNELMLGTAGWLYATYGKPRKAVKYYKRSFEINSSNVFPLRALFSLSNKKAISFNDLLPYMQAWVRLEPESLDAWRSLGIAAHEIDEQLSIRAFETYLQLAKGSEEQDPDEIQQVKQALKEMKSGSDSSVVK